MLLSTTLDLDYAARWIVFCIDRQEDDFAGRLYTAFHNDPYEIRGTRQLLRIIDQFLDETMMVPRMEERRSFVPISPSGRNWNIERQIPQEPAVFRGQLATFRIRMCFRQNTSWQGEALWEEQGKIIRFRSALELILALDDVLEMLHQQKTQVG